MRTHAERLAALIRPVGPRPELPTAVLPPATKLHCKAPAGPQPHPNLSILTLATDEDRMARNIPADFVRKTMRQKLKRKNCLI